MDNVDIEMMNQLFFKHFEVAEMQVSIMQSFSGVAHEELSKIKNRFDIFLNDSWVFKELWSNEKITTEFYLIRRILRLTIEYRSMYFIKKYIQKRFNE